jgi:hypothetical protein
MDAPNLSTAETMIKNDHTEGKVAKAIEEQTSKLPSDTFLWTALGAMGAAAALRLMGRKHLSLFIGQWAAPILVMGLYNKLVKVGGHDQQQNIH